MGGRVIPPDDGPMEGAQPGAAGLLPEIIPTADPGWYLQEDGFNLAREHEIESLFAVSNGYVGTRASLAEGSSLSAPATFIAGIYDHGAGPQARAVLVAAPDWMRLRLIVNGKKLSLESGANLWHRRVLDMRQGLLWREWCHEDESGRITRLRILRMVSRADRHALFQLVELTPENYDGRILVESWIERPARGPAAPHGATPGLLPVRRAPRSGNGHAGPAALALRTRGTGHIVAFSAASVPAGAATDEGDGRPIDAALIEGWLVERRALRVTRGRQYRVNRFVTVFTSRDTPHPVEAAETHLQQLVASGAQRLLAEHVAAWAERWRTADVEVDGDRDAQHALRFAAYHLIAADPEDGRDSIGARALTGGAYQGHVFWDTEIYMLPFFLYTHPDSARALLLYRYHTLPAAREKARRLGWRGALYAWESAETGEETTPPMVLRPDGTVAEILNGKQEHHISADVAYAVWQYWTATRDERFLREAGAEMLFETARFWASRGEMGDDGRYHIRHVIGPDEYHDDVDDSAYTNLLARWNLRRAADAAALLRRCWPERWRELAHRLRLKQSEPAEWRRIAAAMYTGFQPATGLFEQFRGYFEREPIDLAAYAPRTAPIDVLLGPERTRQSQVVKQADVVLLLYLLWDELPAEVRAANFRYYEPRCGHGSSLSPSIHALVAARLGDMGLAMRYFHQAAQIDLANNMGNAAGGVHAAALGGLWQAVTFGFAGLHFRPGGPALDPHLPPGWRRLRFAVQWRGAITRLSTDDSRGEVRS